MAFAPIEGHKPAGFRAEARLEICGLLVREAQYAAEGSQMHRAVNSAKRGEETFEDDVLLLKPHHTEPKVLLILSWLAS